MSIRCLKAGKEAQEKECVLQELVKNKENKMEKRTKCFAEAFREQELAICSGCDH
jgi:hypothetical protein